MSKDVLKDYPIERVHRWYNRLADAALAKKIKGQRPLSGQLLKAYVNPRRGKKIYRFTAPNYLVSHEKVISALGFHRRVYLTEEKARLGRGGGTRKWAGVLPRLRDGRWDGVKPITMYYQCLVDFAPSIASIFHVQYSGSEEDKDLFTSLRGFQLRSNVKITGAKSGKHLKVEFVKWHAMAIDRYDFNYDEHLTLPNPDFAMKFDDAIRPDLDKIRVYHINAKRMVNKGLAVPYDLEVGPWSVAHARITASGYIDPNKRL